MNKLVLLSLYLMFVIKAAGASAHDIQPAGRLIGHDRQNNAIYQVHANGIDLAYKLVGDDVVRLLDALSVKRANVLGYSMGSLIAMELLLDHPQRILKTVLYGTSIDGSDVEQAVAGKGFTNPIIPGVWLVQFKNATHHLMDESPAEFTKIVLMFLEIEQTVHVHVP